MRRRFTDQLQVTQRGIVVDVAGSKLLLSESARSRSDIDKISFNERAQLWPQGLVGYEVNWSLQQIFQEKLQPEVAFGVGRTIELDQDVDVTVGA